MRDNEEEAKQIYQVTHRSTGQKRIIAARAAQNACAGCGWMIGDCHVEELKTYSHPTRRTDAGVYVKLQCNVCSFQWAECKLPNGQKCPCSHDVPDVHEWLRQVTKAHLCNHIGVDLAIKDHQLRQKWLTMEEAVKELSPN